MPPSLPEGEARALKLGCRVCPGGGGGGGAYLPPLSGAVLGAEGAGS